MAAAVVKRQKAKSRSIVAGAYLTDGTTLYEVRETRGRQIRAGQHLVPVVESARLVGVGGDLPDDLEDEAKQGAWFPIAELVLLEVVVPEASA